MGDDVIVIGVGLSGLVAGLRLAQAGRRVLLVAKGIGATHLSSGTVDVLGYAEGLVEHPVSALPSFLAARPGHPYAKTGPAAVLVATEWFKRIVEAEGYPFAGSLADNFLLPTAVGAAKPSALVPRSMAGGDLRQGGSFLIAGFRNLKDFYPTLIADNLSRARLPGRPPISARAILLDPPGLAHEADLGSQPLARAFDRADFRAALADALRPHLQPGERIGFPAVLGLNDPVHAWEDLQARLGTRVFEIPTLPPSVPGIRLYERLTGALRKAGARIQIGFPVIEARVEAGRCASIVTAGSARPHAWHAKHFVLATGGVASGGILAEHDGSVREGIFNLPLTGLPAPGAARFLPGYFENHPFNQVGLAVDRDLRPLNGDAPVIANLHAAGAMLACAQPWKEKSGDGISLVTGYCAAEAILGS